ncbi:hypothetical protein [Aggregatilinea lenta]|uniref:hypothetical protein n=1 Tax=Aggregatilinea lenta TaxID=913108 RepID=UPI0013C312CC|nr:hypothetical protein [Aggregatilinea lenta]
MTAWILSACDGKEASIPVYVTPTAPPDTATPLPLPTLTATPAQVAQGPDVTPSTPTDTATPTATYPPGASYGPLMGVPRTPTPSEPGATSAPPSESPTSASFGPAVGPDQPLLPTETHVGQTPDPNATYGPMVGPDHTLMPTEVRTPVPAYPTVVPTSGPSPTPGPALEADLLGIQVHPHIDSDDFYAALANAHDLGVTWIKYQLNWSLLESSPGQYTDLFYMLRLYIQETHKQGFKVMVGVAKAPLWARAADADGQKPEDGPPSDPQALAAFLSGMLSAIGSDMDGQPYISAVEVWNEPNLEREWQGHALTGAEYMRYFTPAYSAIRAYSPLITVIAAAPAPTGDSVESANDREWLRELYSAGLAQYGADVAIGAHPYGWANPPDAHCCGGSTDGWNESPQFFFLDTLEDYRDIMVNAGHSAAQIWVTEFGWATFDGLLTANGSVPAAPTGSGFFSYVSKQQQAEYTVRAFEIGQRLSYVGPMILWNLNFATLDGAVDTSDQQAGYGLLDNYFLPRPVYYALKQAPKQ